MSADEERNGTHCYHHPVPEHEEEEAVVAAYQRQVPEEVVVGRSRASAASMGA